MSNQFIGLTMLVTLSSPPGAQLRGIVDSIEPGKSLTLRNGMNPSPSIPIPFRHLQLLIFGNIVTCPANGKYVPEFTINASEITELVEAVNENAAPLPSKAKTSSFEDPAILSVGKRPTPVSVGHRPSIPGHWAGNAMEKTDSARTARERDQRALNDITPAATIVDVSPVEIGVEGLILEELEAEADIGPPVKEDVDLPPVKKTRTRRHRQRKKDGAAKDGDPLVTPAKETTKSKGWRQTPLLEPNPSFQPFATLKKNKRRDGRMDENGWATEDATDVQDMGDFDFAGSLAKFDKHEIFNQIQAEDSVADEDRLVAHNRLPKTKPGTAGGKNLHYTENVLDVPNGATKTRSELWKSEAGNSDLEEKTSQRGSGSGRLSRRARKAERSESKLSMNRSPVSRKGSSIISVPPVRTLSVSHSPRPC